MLNVWTLAKETAGTVSTSLVLLLTYGGDLQQFWCAVAFRRIEPVQVATIVGIVVSRASNAGCPTD